MVFYNDCKIFITHTQLKQFKNKVPNSKLNLIKLSNNNFENRMYCDWLF